MDASVTDAREQIANQCRRLNITIEPTTLHICADVCARVAGLKLQLTLTIAKCCNEIERALKKDTKLSPRHHDTALKYVRNVTHRPCQPQLIN
jgi:hypothetical protein